jgi:hypothetical protein
MYIGSAGSFAASCLFKFFNIRPRGKRSTRTDYHYGRDRGVLFGGIDGGRKPFRDSRAQGIHGWVVNGDDGNFAVLQVSYEFVHSRICCASICTFDDNAGNRQLMNRELRRERKLEITEILVARFGVLKWQNCDLRTKPRCAPRSERVPWVTQG